MDKAYGAYAGQFKSVWQKRSKYQVIYKNTALFEAVLFWNVTWNNDYNLIIARLRMMLSLNTYTYSTHTLLHIDITNDSHWFS